MKHLQCFRRIGLSGSTVAKYSNKPLKELVIPKLQNNSIRNVSSSSIKKKSGSRKGPFDRFFTLPMLTAGILLSFLLDRETLFSDSIPHIPVEEVAKHSTIDDCWIVIDGKVYDVSKLLAVHPGGVARIFKVAGSDATDEFRNIHSVDVLEKMLPFVTYLGELIGEFEVKVSEEDVRIANNMANKPPLSEIFSLSDFSYVAKAILPESTYYYFATGSTDEFTLRENHYAYSRVFFRPKVLQNISFNSDTSTDFMGSKVSLPVYITAFAGSKYAHPLGERNLQRAAYNANVMQMVPKQCSYTPKEFFDEVPSNQNQWCQFHFDNVEELENYENILKEMETRPSVKGIFINVDLASIGNREKDRRSRIKDDAGAAALSGIVPGEKYFAPLNWSHIEKMIAATRLPIALKGVQRGEDVVIAAEKGVKGVVLSNHGGRQLDFSRPTLEVLVEAKNMLKEKNLENKIDIFLDGGVSRGSDVVKALCLGAKGVGLGRPFLYAMAGYGEEGVSKLLDILRKEVKVNMSLLGVDKIEDLTEDLVDTTNLKFRSPVVSDRLYDKAYHGLEFPRFRNLDVNA